MIEYSERNIKRWSMLGPSGVLGLAACEFAGRDDNFAMLTADLCSFSGLERLKNTYPDKLYNLGIAEQNMVGVAAGMAKEGMNAFAVTYATFCSTRALDQVRVNMGYMKLPVTLIGLTSGYSAGILGATHMAIEDIAIMRSIPNIVVLSPSDGTETMKALEACFEMDRPVYIRMSGQMRNPIIYNEDYSFEVGKAVHLQKGSDIAIIATGTMVKTALDVADEMRQKDISCEVGNMHTIKPVDEEAVKSLTDRKLIVTIEEHSRIGGLGSAVAEVLSEVRNKPPQLIIGVEDYYLHGAPYDALIERSGLKADKIVDRIMRFL